VWRKRSLARGSRGGREPERRKRDSSTAQADPFTGVKGEEKIGLLRFRNDSGWSGRWSQAAFWDLILAVRKAVISGAWPFGSAQGKRVGRKRFEERSRSLPPRRARDDRQGKETRN